ncbi:unnamed protein product [Parnassius apollo]|uniref:(apollo) hypothetical protein n=1 Tax=Parnassius apollo TaxID=110799 RepID=A0A8S3WEN7_PARAO|nr:unnamed protein product [Parnassius apollo]
MLLRFSIVIFLWSKLIATIVALPTDEFKKFINQGELAFDDEKFLMHIVPSGYPSQKSKYVGTHLSEIVDEGLTFNIYDENLRDASVALFRLLQSLEADQLHKVTEWAKVNINDDLFAYAKQLAIIYANRNEFKSDFHHEPPYIAKPNYFINGETIKKAQQLIIDNGQITDQESRVNQIYKHNDIIAINTNYSGWNLPSNGCHEDLNYFREDIGINSYYYGVQLLHPFWMSNNEMEEINPQHAEYYYYTHKQLMARYNLERLYLKYEKNKPIEKCYTDYNPYLYYDNGLPFPIRSSTLKEWNEEQAKIKSIDIAIKECVSRKVIFMDNGTKIPLTEDNYVDLLAKILRANLDGIKSAKFVRSFFGYGGNTYPLNSYNPAPSVLHHPETSLRDPVYWYLIKIFLNYFNEFEKNLEPFDISKYEDNEIKIVKTDIPKITTYFSYFQFILNKGLGINLTKLPYAITARLKRLNHVAFAINFIIESKSEKPVIVRLFLGPECHIENCWISFSNFFELDSFHYKLHNGINNITWSPSERLSKFSFENFYNMEEQFNQVNRYNLFNFPVSMIIPRGTEEGLNLTLFVIITPMEDLLQRDMPVDYSNNYQKYLSEVSDKKPLGFPFHREATKFKPFANNYRFYNISVFHKKRIEVGENGYFSKHLN